MGNLVGAWVERSVITVEGPDSASYLQGQLSQDVASMNVADSRWSLLLAPSGKTVAWLRVHRVGDEAFVLDLEPAAAPDALARLERFKLRVEVAMSLAVGHQMLSVRSLADAGAGAGADADVVVPAQAASVLVGAPAGSSVGVRGVDLICSDPALIAAPAGMELDPVAVERLRISHGVPTFGVDFDEDTIPAELGPWLVEESVSWTKGCYTGQELVARVDARGNNTPRHLSVLVFDDPGAMVQIGAEVVANTLSDGVVGAVTSSNHGVALSLLKRSVEPDTRVTVGSAEAVVTRVAAKE